MSHDARLALPSSISKCLAPETSSCILVGLLEAAVAVAAVVGELLRLATATKYRHATAPEKGKIFSLVLLHLSRSR